MPNIKTHLKAVDRIFIRDQHGTSQGLRVDHRRWVRIFLSNPDACGANANAQARRTKEHAARVGAKVARAIRNKQKGL